MALTPCLECGEDIPKSAKTCPHCGEPRFKHKKDPAKRGGLGLIALVMFVLSTPMMCAGLDRIERSAGCNEQPVPAAPPAPIVEAPKEEIPVVSGWRARKVDEFMDYKVSYDVWLDRRMTKEELYNIARRIKSPRHQKTFMCHRLHAGTTGMCWATTHATPEIEVVTFGSP